MHTPGLCETVYLKLRLRAGTSQTVVDSKSVSRFLLAQLEPYLLLVSLLLGFLAKENISLHMKKLQANKTKGATVGGVESGDQRVC